MDTVSFHPSEAFQPAAAQLVQLVAELVRQVAPEALVEDMGGTAVPGLLTKGDVDVNVRVNRVDFEKTVEFLRVRLNAHQIQNWTDGYASFSDDNAYALPLGVQLTVLGHPDDKFVAQRDRLASDPRLIDQYNELKRRHEGSSMAEYRTAKWAFIAAHLEQA